MEPAENAVVLSWKYDELPEKVKQGLKKANVFFTPSYERYANQVGFTILYAYTASNVAVIDVYPVYTIKFAVFPSEIFQYSGDTDSAGKQRFLDDVIAVLKEKTDIAWISTGTTSLFDIYPSDSSWIPFGSYVADLTLSVEQLWRNVSSSHKNCVNRARKKGLILRIGGKELIDDYLILDKDTWNRSGQQGYDYEFLSVFDEGFGSNSLICVVYKDEVPQAGACYFFNNEMVYNIYSASSNTIAKGAMKFLHWEMMMYFKEMGIKRFNFVGYRFNVDRNSKYYGIQEFKKRFGTELLKGYMFRCILKPSRRQLFQQLYKVKNGHEFLDTIDLEAHKWAESDRPL